MKVNGIPTRTIRALDNGSAIEIIDQTLLPYRFEKRILSDWRDGVEAIETMRVRGAPLIGIAGAWSVVLAVKENPDNGPLLAYSGCSSYGCQPCLGSTENADGPVAARTIAAL